MVKMHSSEEIVQFSCLISSIVNVFRQLEYESDLSLATNMRLVIGKLPPNLKEKWYGYTSAVYAPKPSLIVFDSWLQRIADTHEQLMGLRSSALSTSKDIVDRTSDQVDRTKSKKKNGSTGAAATADSDKYPCKLCKSAHKLFDCPVFKKKSLDDRHDFVKSNNYCFNCLQYGHMIRNCRRNELCGVDGCNKKHHKLLHRTQKEAESSGAVANQELEDVQSTSCSSSTTRRRGSKRDFTCLIGPAKEW